MIKYCIFSSIILLLGLGSSAEAITIDWASVVSNTNAFSPEKALGKPDAIHAMFGMNTGITRYGTYSGFGSGENINYDINGFATLLGVSEEILNKSDFFTTEFQGGSDSPYEEGMQLLFSDGLNTLLLDYPDFTNPAYSGPIIAYGNINNYAYADFFGFSNPLPQYGDGNNWAFLLIDINGYSAVDTFSSNFSVTMTAADSGGPTDPDPDVMGRINSIPNPIPEPSSILLLSLGLLSTGFLSKYRRK